MRTSSRRRFSSTAMTSCILAVIFRKSQAVDAGDRSDDDHIFPFDQGTGGGEAHPIDLVVDGQVLFDVGIGAGDIGFGLVVIVIGDKIFDGIVGKKDLNS